MPKKYAILAAALVASGRSLSTPSISEQDGREWNFDRVADDWPFCDRSVLAVADFRSSSETSRREPVDEPMSLPQ
jgi:hypothetical protein